jgi:ankyrin repeat protein/adenylate kinase family enzyme
MNIVMKQIQTPKHITYMSLLTIKKSLWVNFIILVLLLSCSQQSTVMRPVPSLALLQDTCFKEIEEIENLDNQEREDLTNLLHQAVLKGNLEDVHTLLTTIDINTPDKQGNTPLHLAVLQGNLALVDFLLEAKAAIDIRNIAGLTPLHIAAQKGSIPLMQLLIAQHTDNNTQDDYGYAPLHLAAQNGHPQAIQLLLNNKANVNAKHKSGRSPLHLAAGEGHKETVQLLLDSKANVNAKSNHEWTPLHYAAYNGNTESAQLLIEKKANIHAKNKYDGRLPLHLAKLEGHQQTIQLLLDSQAAIENRNNYDDKSLHIAAQNSYLGATQLPLDSKENGHTKDKEEKEIQAAAIQNYEGKEVVSGGNYEEIVIFCGNPGAGKSTLCNSIFQRAVFQSGVSDGTGLTRQQQAFVHQHTKYIDTPGLLDADEALMERAAREIEKALKENSNHKIIFVATLASGRIKSEDLATINKICTSVKVDFEYGIIFNKLTKPVIALLQENQAEMKKYLGTLRKQPASIVMLEKDRTIADANNVFFSADSENRGKLLDFIAGLKANRISINQVESIDVADKKAQSKELSKELGSEETKSADYQQEEEKLGKDLASAMEREREIEREIRKIEKEEREATTLKFALDVTSTMSHNYIQSWGHTTVSSYTPANNTFGCSIM